MLQNLEHSHWKTVSKISKVLYCLCTIQIVIPHLPSPVTEWVSTCLTVTDVDGDQVLAVSRPLCGPTCPCLLTRLCDLWRISCDLLPEFQTRRCAWPGCGSCAVTVPTCQGNRKVSASRHQTLRPEQVWCCQDRHVFCICHHFLTKHMGFNPNKIDEV